jgi:tetratricopeptide (TPR) repeat protein
MKQKATIAERDAIVFLDTETTGIQGGTGIVPFLVGLGYFEGEVFRMVQYFIRDFDEEPSMLLALGDLLRRFKLVITYNGATFDIPLLETRFTLARLDSPFTSLSHLDLLPGARRLWRNGHGSCRLAALENRIVTFFRGPDIPGSMIPQAYFDFLRGRGSDVISSVLKHNVHDVVSLAALTIAACDRVVDEPAALDNPLDLYSLARIMDNTADWKYAVRLYEMALRGGLPDPILFKAHENLAVLSRRTGDHVRALALCEGLMTHSLFSMAAHEGAAIHYERIAGDPLRALEIVERALARLEETPETRRWRASLQARRERLQQKVIQFQ